MSGAAPPQGFNASENVAQVGGQAVPSPGSPYAGPVLPVGGNDGTNARALATDTTGALKLAAGTNTVGAVSAVNNQAPINKALVFNTAESANTNILAAAISPTNAPSTLRVQVALSVAAVVNVMLTRGTTTVTLSLNGGSTLAANAVYVFDVIWHSGDSVNFQVSAAVTVLELTADEIDAAA